jgi:adenine-specific DNA-methyltransferase
LFGGKPDFSESQPIVKRTNSVGRLKFPSNTVNTKLEDGSYKKGTYGTGSSSVKLLNDITVDNGIIINEFELEGPFTWGQENLNREIEQGATVIINTINLQVRVFKSENADSFKGLISLINGVEISGTNEDGYEQLRDLLGNEKLLDYPKPINYLKVFINSQTYFESNAIIMDFFAGSGSTAHAVMDLNKEDGGNRKYICVQLPELTEEKTEAYKAGYKTIADISKERIRRASKKVAEEIKTEIQKAETEIEKLKGEIQTEETKAEIENLQSKNEQLKTQDLGFKVLKLDESNFKQWQQIASKDAKALQEQMQLFIDPVSENATIENMVYELLLKSGKDINSQIEKQNDFYAVNNNELILLLEKATQEIIDTVIALKPKKVIALDKLFKDNDQLKTNTVLQMRDAGVEFKTI